MTELFLTNPLPYDISITLAIFDYWKNVTRRTFHLRNLTGKDDNEQTLEATAIMAEVAAELHHITGYGIDKGTVKLNGKKVYEVVYRDYAPQAGARDFRYGIHIRLGAVRSYRKVDERRRSKSTGEVTTNDEPQWYIRNESKTVTFSIPCAVSSSNQPQEQRKYFFLHSGVAKRGRKVIGWECHFDRHDVLYNRFISRFYDEGNLAIGQKRHWCVSGANLSVRGIDWPVVLKFKADTIPRKSKIASQPKDDTDYVYLIRMGRTRFYKIGKSNDPQGRLATMQTASPHKLKMLHVFKADNAAAAEETLHHKLHGAKMEGEWFKLTDEQQKVIANITAYEGGQFIIEGIKRSIEEIFRDENNS